MGVPTKGEDQNVDGWISVLTDVTDTRRAQEESFAKQKLETIGTLAGGIAHDFNNLLGACWPKQNWRWRSLRLVRLRKMS